jgi:ABC-type sugar transport system substrate-binding protein
MLCLVLVAVPTTGQSPGPAEPGAQGSSGGTTIGFTNLDSSNPFFAQIEAGLREAAAEAGVDLVAMDAMNSTTMQSGQIDDFVADRVDAIIVVPVDAMAIVPSVMAAGQAGIPVLAVDRSANSDAVTSVIASDNVAGARTAGEMLFDAMGGRGKVVEILGDVVISTAKDRADGFQEALDAAPGVTRSARGSAFWDAAEAAAITTRALARDPGVTGVFAAAGDMLEGVARAVDAAGMTGQVKVVGFDTSSTILGAIRDGRIHATIAQQPRLMGRTAMETAIAAAIGEPVAPFVAIDTIVVTADNVDSFETGQ